MQAKTLDVVDPATEQAVGAPTKEDTDLGPVAYDRQYRKVLGLIRKGIDEGATPVTGGPDKPRGNCSALLFTDSPDRVYSTVWRRGKRHVFGEGAKRPIDHARGNTASLCPR